MNKLFTYEGESAHLNAPQTYHPDEPDPAMGKLGTTVTKDQRRQYRERWELKQDIKRRISLIPPGFEITVQSLNLDETTLYRIFGETHLESILGEPVRQSTPEGKELLSPIQFMYLNYRGELSRRTVHTRSHAWFGSTEQHKDNQHLLTAFDFDKRALRTFAISDIRPVCK